MFSQNTIKQEKEIQGLISYLKSMFYKHKIDGANLQQCCSSCNTAQCPLLSTGVTCFKKGHIWQLRKEKKKKKEKKEIIFDYINPLPGHRVLIQLREWD